MNEQIQALETELKEVQSRLDVIEQGGGDQSELKALTDRKNEISNKISELQYEAEREQAIEEKVEAEAVPFSIAGVNLAEVPVEIVKAIEAVVKADRRRSYAEHAAELEQKDTDHELCIRQLEADNQDLKNRVTANDIVIENGKSANASLIRENGDLRDFTAQQNRDIEDLRSKLDNAATQLGETHAEIERLNSEIEDYQKAKAFGEKEAQGIIDITPEESNDIAAALENVKKLYTKTEDWGSKIQVFLPDGSYKLVPRSEVEAEWEPLTVPAMGGSDTQESFLGQDQTTDHNGDTESAETATETVGESFRTEESTTAGLADTPSTMDRTAYVTWEAFEAFKQEVDSKIAGVYGVAV